MNIDIESSPKSVRKEIEVLMRKGLTDKVNTVHKYAISQNADGRYSTKVMDGDKRKSIHGKDLNTLYQNLYKFYFPNGIKSETFDDFFRQMVDNAKDFGKARVKTISEWEKDYKRFFEGTKFSQTELKKISIKELASFLDEAHTKLSKPERLSEKTCIEKHRHDQIKTIINKTYCYANTYLGTDVLNPISMIDYSNWPYYRSEDQEKDYYTEEEVIAILEVFDSIENPRLPQLAVIAKNE